MEKHVLSKSTFIRGLKCHKSLYLNKHHKKLRDELSDMQLAIFDQGTTVGELAQDLFPDGKDCTPENYYDFTRAIRSTNEFIENNEKTIYEGAFQYDGVLAALDILDKDNEGWKAYEVKSSTSVSKTHIMDAAIQYYAITNSGVDLKDISIVYINNKYKKNGAIDLQNFFSIESVLERVIELQQNIPKQILELKKILLNKDIPNNDIGTHCTSPYNCDFRGHCWAHIPDYSIFNLSNLNLDRKFELYYNNILKFDNIPKDFKLSKNQKIQIECELNEQSIINKEKLSDFINDLQYPLHFLDFETFNTAIPIFENTRPYQQLVFQYSLHIKGLNDNTTDHYEFLAETDGTDPRIKFIKQLIENCRDEGDILVYNISFERSKLLELAETFPEFSIPLIDITERMKDLMTPFQKKWYYTPEMKGSYSIKYVLPGLVPELSYQTLNIKEGATASLMISKMIEGNFKGDTDQTKKDLLAYCKLDTLAMVKILEKIESVMKK